MDSFAPSTLQLARLDRSVSILDAKNIPRYQGPLYTDDDNEVTLRSPQETARRALVVWAIALRADGMPQTEALELLDQWKLWADVSPEEVSYIRDPDPDEDITASYVWRLETVWVLMWALGRISELGWPAWMCDVPHLVEVMKPVEADPNFIETAQLRSVSEILDAQDLTMRLHWTIRDAYLGMRPICSDLDWSNSDPDVPVTQSAAVGVIEQRHQTLNWLIRFGDADWDSVDTPT